MLISFLGKKPTGLFTQIDGTKLTPESIKDFGSAVDKEIAAYEVLIESMETFGGAREYPQKQALLAALLPKIADIDSASIAKAP